MHHKGFGLPVMATILATCPLCPTVASPPQAARAGIQAALTERAHARHVENLSAYMATFTPNWVTVNVVGRIIPYATLRRSMAANFASARAQGTVHSRIIKITVAGPRALVTVDTRFDYPVARTPTGPVSQYKNTVSSEVWVRGPTGWQEQRERYLSDSGGVSAVPVPKDRK